MGAALPLQTPPDAAAGRGSSHRQWPDVRKRTEGESEALHSLVRIEGVRFQIPSAPRRFRVSGHAFADKFGIVFSHSWERREPILTC